MKKDLGLIAIFAFSFCLFLAAITSAGFIEISEDLAIVGHGTIDRDVRLQSEPDFSGQKLTETILPIYSGHGNSTASYRSNFEFIQSNNSTLYYASDSELQDVKHYLQNKNYKLGVYTGFYYIGSQKKSFIFESAPSFSEATVKSEAEGRSVLRARVVNESFTHQRTIDSLTWLEGNYILGWNFRVLEVEYPEVGAEWMACP